MGLPAGEEGGAGPDAADVGDRGHLGAGDLALAGLAPQLADGPAVAEGGVQAAAGELAAPGVGGQVAVEAEACAALDKAPPSPTPQKPWPRATRAARC